MPKLSGADYEKLVHELVSTFRQAPGMENYAIGAGTRNRMVGASGYRHQIDLSLESSERIFLLELKHYLSSVGVAELLVLAARLQDISAANKHKLVRALLVSKRKPSRNVPPLAQFFSVQVEVVESAHAYGLSFANLHFVGITEAANATDSCDAVVIRGPTNEA